MAGNRVDEPDDMGAFRRRLLLAVDAKGYGRADAFTQRQFQEEITRLLGEAADAARLDRARWVTQAGGDSLFAVLPEGASEPALVDAFMRALDAGLRAFNHNRVREARLRLRAAVHFGPASPGANGFVDRAPVETGRILDCAALRNALVEAPDACLAVGLSETVFRDVVEQAHTTFRADEFRCVRVEEKEYLGEAWIWVPGTAEVPGAPGVSGARARQPESALKTAPAPAPNDASVYNVWANGSGPVAVGPAASAMVNHHHASGSSRPTDASRNEEDLS